MGNRIFIAASGGGIARASEGNSGEWQVEKLLGDRYVTCLSSDPLDKGRVYAGTQGEGVLRSEDGGRTWRASGLEGRVVKAVAASPVQRGVVYASTRPACMFVSRDGGDSWAELRGFRRIPWRWTWF